MGTILKIALRNLTQHKAKTLIIGLLIVLATFLSFLGNSVLGSASQSMKQVFTQQFTGDVMVVPSKLQGGIFGGQQEDLNGPPILPTMPDFQKVYDLVAARPEVQKITSQLSSYALYNFGDQGTSFGLLFGIEPASYWSTFDAVTLLSGRKITNGETGVVMLHESTLKRIKDQTDVELKVGDTFQLNNFGETGFKVREVKIVGTFRFKNANDRAFDIMQPGFVDVQTLRALTGKAVTTAADLQLKQETQSLLSENTDDFFSGSTAVQGRSARPVDLAGLTSAVANKRAQVDAASAREGTWNFQLVKLKAGVDDDAFAKSMTAEFQKAGLPAKAQNWITSASPDSGFFYLVMLALNIAIILLAVVSIFVIMNTLVVSVMERTSEIGTMRALGAQKSTIRWLFITETFLITLFSGVIGLFFGFVGLIAVNASGIPGPGGWLQSAFPGGVLHPEVNAAALPFTLSILLVIGLVSWIFPVLMATKVSPLKAISTD
jgi:putative ABC transport system permease protein